MNTSIKMNQKEICRIVSLFCSDILQPEIRKLEGESSQRVNAVVEVIHDNAILESKEMASTATHAGDDATLRVRIRLIQGNEKGLYRFRCQAISSGLAQETGLSGFSMTGSIQESSPSKTTVELLSYRYNVWGWESKYQVKSVE